MKRLIIVPGHASFNAEVTLPLPDDFEKDSYWALKDFQLGEPPFYIAHIAKALEVASDDSLVVFSGGRTKKESGEFWSEAKTYDEIAKTFQNYPTHTATEEYSRDSFQNLDFSMRKYASLYGQQALKITVVGWAFKESRFKIHAEALGIPLEHLEYIGVNNPPEEKMVDTLLGESNILKEYLTTPLGNSGTLLERRRARDPFNDGEPKDY